VTSFLLAACGSNGGDGAAVDDTAATSSEDVGRGPAEIALDGYPNGVWWDDASSTLYIADDRNNRVLTWTDDAGIGVLGDLPEAASASPGLGQLVMDRSRRDAGSRTTPRRGGCSSRTTMRRERPTRSSSCRSTDARCRRHGNGFLVTVMIRRVGGGMVS
jgi:hypothetical protein